MLVKLIAETAAVIMLMLLYTAHYVPTAVTTTHLNLAVILVLSMLVFTFGACGEQTAITAKERAPPLAQ
jgi:hypothetical protein